MALMTMTMIMISWLNFDDNGFLSLSFISFFFSYTFLLRHLLEWISFPVFEHVKWMNKLLSKLWPFTAEATTMVIKESVEPLLD